MTIWASQRRRCATLTRWGLCLHRPCLMGSIAGVADHSPCAVGISDYGAGVLEWLNHEPAVYMPVRARSHFAARSFLQGERAQARGGRLKPIVSEFGRPLTFQLANLISRPDWTHHAPFCLPTVAGPLLAQLSAPWPRALETDLVRKGSRSDWTCHGAALMYFWDRLSELWCAKQHRLTLQHSQSVTSKFC